MHAQLVTWFPDHCVDCIHFVDCASFGNVVACTGPMAFLDSIACIDFTAPVKCALMLLVLFSSLMLMESGGLGL